MFNWIPTDENIKLLDDKTAKFIFEQAEKQLKEVSETSTLIVTRTSTLITVSVGLIVALMGYSFSRISNHTFFDSQFIAAVFGAIYLFTLCFFLTLNIKPKKYFAIGAEPKGLLNDDTMQEEKDLYKEPLVKLYVNEIVNYQNKIEKNKAVNEKRWQLFNTSLWMLVLTPVVLFFVYCLVNLLKMYLWYSFQSSQSPC